MRKTKRLCSRINVFENCRSPRTLLHARCELRVGDGITTIFAAVCYLPGFRLRSSFNIINTNRIDLGTITRHVHNNQSRVLLI